jgi:hypothetical protein
VKYNALQFYNLTDTAEVRLDRYRGSQLCMKYIILQFYNWTDTAGVNSPQEIHVTDKATGNSNVFIILQFYNWTDTAAVNSPHAIHVTTYVTGPRACLSLMSPRDLYKLEASLRRARTCLLIQVTCTSSQGEPISHGLL